MAQAPRRWLYATYARCQFLLTASEFLDGRNGTGAEFSLLFFDFLLPVIIAPLLHVSLSPQLSSFVDLTG